MEEVEAFSKRLDQIEGTFGLWGVLIFIFLAIFFLALWKYFGITIERAAAKSSEEALKKIQSHFDKELVKFSTKHQKQIDAVHECYSRLQRLTYLIDYLHNGEKFLEASEPRKDLSYLILARHEFKKVYRENKLVLPTHLNEHIERLLPAVDDYISTYERGLFNLSEEEIEFNSEHNKGVYIAGIWPTDAFDHVLIELKEIGEEIEKAFRKIYGTDL